MIVKILLAIFPCIRRELRAIPQITMRDSVKVMNATAKNCQEKSRVNLIQTTDIRIKYDVWGQATDRKKWRVY